MGLTDIFRPEHICFVTVAKEIRLQGGGKTAHSASQLLLARNPLLMVSGKKIGTGAVRGSASLQAASGH